MSMAPVECRPGCGACCIAPSISSPIPQSDGTPARPKAAGERCSQLDEHLRCRLFGLPQRPAVCASLRPEATMCGAAPSHALAWLTRLEHLTSVA